MVETEEGIEEGDMSGGKRDVYRSFFFFQAEDGIRDVERSRALGDVYHIQDEFNSLSTCQTTVEVLKVKSPVLSYLLSCGRLGLAKLLKPVYNKTTKQLKTYQSSLGYGYYYDGVVFGVVERTDYGVSIILDPINLTTLEKELHFDLLKEVEE